LYIFTGKIEKWREGGGTEEERRGGDRTGERERKKDRQIRLG